MKSLPTFTIRIRDPALHKTKIFIECWICTQNGAITIIRRATSVRRRDNCSHKAFVKEKSCAFNWTDNGNSWKQRALSIGSIQRTSIWTYTLYTVSKTIIISFIFTTYMKNSCLIVASHIARLQCDHKKQGQLPTSALIYLIQLKQHENSQ